MFNKIWIKSLPAMLLMFFLGFSAPGWADMGMGYGPYPRWGHHPMHAWHHGEDEGCGFGYWGDLSEEDIQKLEQERADFFEATKNLRAEIYQKRLELRSELAKENPDAKKAAELQTEISKLRAEFDQKRLNHFMNMRKITPDIGRGFGGGYGMMRRGYGMGPGMMGPGYGMGPGMMGPGYGMGPGMMGPGWQGGMGPYTPYYGDNPQQMGRHSGPLEKADAQELVEDYIRSTRNPNLKTGKIEDTGSAFKVQIVTKDNSLVEEVLIDKNSGYMRPAY